MVRGILSLATGVSAGSVKGSKTAGSSSTLGKSGIKLSSQMLSNLQSSVARMWCVLTHMAKIIHENNEDIMQTRL